MYCYAILNQNRAHALKHSQTSQSRAALIQILLLVLTKVQENPGLPFQLELSHFVATNNVAMPKFVNADRLNSYLAVYDYNERNIFA